MATFDRRFGEHPCGLLERRGRQPRVGGERGLGDAHELGATLGGLLALLDELAVELRVTAAVDLLAGQERRVTRLGDPRTRRSIWRTITSMCLSWIGTPCSRYTFWTSSTR